MTRLDFASLLSSGNLRAWFRVIRAGESWNDRDDPQHDELAYRVRYHPKTFPTYFDAFDQHPRIFELLPDGSGRRSSAAGAFQETATTWDDMRGRYEGFGPTFGPWDQEACAVAIMHFEGALDDVIAGNFDAALPKLAKRWASLPNSPLVDGGRKLTYAKARQVYEEWGGAYYRPEAVVAPEPAPIEDRSQPARPEEKPMAPTLIMGLLASLMEIFSPVLRAKLTRVLDKQTGDTNISGQVADKVISFAQQAAAQVLPGVVAPPPGVPGTPAPAAPVDPVVAVGAVKSNAALAAQVEAQVSDYLDQLAPVLDRLERLDQAAWQASEASMDAAAARSIGSRNDDWMARVLVLGILGMSVGIVLFVGGVAIAQIVTLQTRSPTTEVWAFLTGIGGTILGILGTVFAYRFGTSRSSAAKDVVIEELSNRRTRNV